MKHICLLLKDIVSTYFLRAAKKCGHNRTTNCYECRTHSAAYSLTHEIRATADDNFAVFTSLRFLISIMY